MSGYSAHRLDDLALALHEWLESHSPATIREIETALDVDYRAAHQAIHHHRNYLSSETCALVEYTVGHSHLYKLSTDASEIGSWTIRRARDADTRLRTMFSQADVAVRVTDGRSADGKRARLRRKFLGRLIEDMDELVR